MLPSEKSTGKVWLKTGTVVPLTPVNVEAPRELHETGTSRAD